MQKTFINFCGGGLKLKVFKSLYISDIIALKKISNEKMAGGGLSKKGQI
jgi:hypothetical protein